MIQHARNHTSISLFREAGYATIVLDNLEKESYFAQLKADVARNRQNPDLRYTGAKALRTEFLAALNQLGEVKTANIWARKLLVESNAIESVRVQIEKILRENHIYGVVEIHLQDYEINSTHIQFMGIKAAEAEKLIAELMVKLGYEDSFASAVGREERQEVSKPIQPPKAPKPLTTETTQYDELELKLEEELEKLKNLNAQRIDDLMRKIHNQIEKLLQEFQQKNPRNEDTDTLLEKYKMRKEKKD